LWYTIVNMEAQEQQKISKVPPQLQPHVFKKGQSGNPNGRPKGSISLKEWAKNYIQTLTDEERLDFLEGMDKKTIWEMAEGKAESNNKTDITTGGEKIVFMPPEVLARLDNDTPPETE